MSLLRLENYIFAQIENQFRLYEVLPEGFAWHIDMTEELLTFYDPATEKIALKCPFQLVGSKATAPQTFLWAWANTESNLPAAVLEHVRKLKSVAETEGKGEPFTSDQAFALPYDEFGMEMSVLCAGVGGGFCTYACGYDGGVLYTVVETVPQAKALPPDPLRTIRAITTGISAVSFDHKEAVRAYLGEPSADGVYAKAGIKVAFDEQGRIGEMSAVLEPPKRSASPLDSLKRLFGR
ncbi:MAG: hypothetical protein H8F28_02875 [Fibrella sp.]|nr:hypothetical protein [Armatimonadota bacterium]